MPHGMHPLIESGILLTSISALLLNLFFNGSEDHRSESIAAAKMSED
jgi:NCS2 family nucleobase:cation symporter-2